MVASAGLLVMVSGKANTTTTDRMMVDNVDCAEYNATEWNSSTLSVPADTKETSTRLQSATTINTTTTTTTTGEATAIIVSSTTFLSTDTDKLPNNTAIIAGVVCGVGGVIIIAFIVLFVICWKRRRSSIRKSSQKFKPARNRLPTSLVPPVILTADDAPPTHVEYASIVPLSSNSSTATPQQQNFGTHQNFAFQAPAVIYAELSEETASSTVAPPAAETPTHYAQIVKSTVTAGEQEGRDVGLTFQGANSTADSGVEYSQLFSSARNGKR